MSMSATRALDQILADLGALGVTDNDEDVRRTRMIRNAAQEDCSVCSECGKELAPDAEVWRPRISLGPSGFGGWHTRIVPVCKKCWPKAGRERHFWPPEPCEGCGRLVRNDTLGSPSKHVFCCEQCAKKAQSKAAREARAKRREGMTCEACGKKFTPPRADVKFCSNAVSAHTATALRLLMRKSTGPAQYP
jgi:hypothetical protein